MNFGHNIWKLFGVAAATFILAAIEKHPLFQGVAVHIDYHSNFALLVEAGNELFECINLWM
jgi:hypothetical protein